MIDKPKFNENKATALAVFLLQKANKTMSYMKLIKLMYLVDRASLCSIGQFVTNDDFYSMKNGPVLSNVDDLITEPMREKTVWGKYISAPVNYNVSLKNVKTDSILGLLSEFECEIATDVYNTYGKMDKWKLVDWTHKNLPEWTNIKTGRYPINIEIILASCGKTKEEIKEIVLFLAEQAQTERFFA